MKHAPELHQERINALEKEIKRLQSQLDHERGQLAWKNSDKLVNPDIPDMKCDCGAFIGTEKAHWEHFVIRDTRYLNLGDCPAR